MFSNKRVLLTETPFRPLYAVHREVDHVMVAIIRALPLLLVDGEAESLLVMLYILRVQVADGAVFGYWGRRVYAATAEHQLIKAEFLGHDGVVGGRCIIDAPVSLVSEAAENISAKQSLSALNGDAEGVLEEELLVET